MVKNQSGFSVSDSFDKFEASPTMKARIREIKFSNEELSFSWLNSILNH